MCVCECVCVCVCVCVCAYMSSETDCMSLLYDCTRTCNAYSKLCDYAEIL